MTPLARADLQWFADHGPIGWFDRTAPTDAMRRRLLRQGLIEELRPPAGMIKYQITSKGRDALKTSKPT
jgi:hypothetical protein